MQPLISVIVPCLNAESYIDDCLKSIINQRNCSYELIVVDGGSKDGTLQIINNYINHIKVLISEPDSGQSDAINKGLKHCTGNLFSWLNADDYYFKGALEAIATTYQSNQGTIISGSTRFFGGIHGLDGVYVSPKNINFEDVLSIWTRDFIWAQPSTFFPLDNSVKLNKKLHLAMDYDLLLQMLIKYNCTLIKSNITNFRIHNQAKTNVLGFKNAIELPLIINSYKSQSKNFKNIEFLKFKSRCQIILAKNSIKNRNYISAVSLILKAFKFHLTQPWVMLSEYFFNLITSDKSNNFDAFKVNK